jgi:hypothetical protein
LIIPEIIRIGAPDTGQADKDYERHQGCG